GGGAGHHERGAAGQRSGEQRRGKGENGKRGIRLANHAVGSWSPSNWASTPSQMQCRARMCTSWMRAVRSCGTQMCTSVSRRTLALEAADELRREVLRIGCGATVAAREHLASAGDACEHGLHRVGDGLAQGLRRLVLQVGALDEVLLYALLEHGASMIALRAP